MLELKAEGWYRVQKYGFVAAISELPEEFYEKYWDPIQLKGEQVLIDDEIFTVAGVETFMIGRSESSPYRGSCGLLVKES